MSVQILNTKVLGAFSRILRLGGGNLGPDRIESKLPIQTVYDFSRQSERGSGFGAQDGYFMVEEHIIHAGATTQYSVVSIDTPLISEFEKDRSEMDVWLIRIFPWSDANVITDARAALLLKPYFYGTTSGGQPSRLLFNTGGYVIITTAPNSYAPVDEEVTPGDFPIWLPEGSQIGLRSTSSGAGDNYFGLLCWCGPRGVTPPGVP